VWEWEWERERERERRRQLVKRDGEKAAIRIAQDFKRNACQSFFLISSTLSIWMRAIAEAIESDIAIDLERRREIEKAMTGERRREERAEVSPRPFCFLPLFSSLLFS
jgi:hypothetical protein